MKVLIVRVCQTSSYRAWQFTACSIGNEPAGDPCHGAFPDSSHGKKHNGPHLVGSERDVLRHNNGHGVQCDNLVQLVSDVVRVYTRLVGTMCI